MSNSKSDHSLLPVWFIEPDVSGKRKQLALSREQRKPPKFDMSEVKQTLLDIRKDTMENLERYEKTLKRNLKKKYDIKVISVPTGLDAVEYISDITGDIDTVAINRSSTVREIMTDIPEDLEFNFFDSYEAAVESSFGAQISDDYLKDRGSSGYWDFFGQDPVQIWNSFNIEPSIKGYYRSKAPSIPGEYASLMGVNCLTAEGNLFLLQHLQNMV